MCQIGPILERLWKDESGISSVEYALLLAFIAAGIIAAADTLSNAVMDQFSETAGLFDGAAGDGCGNDGGGDGTGGDDGSGQGGDNTC
jgi:Flp pilus assembly pilin Flp